MGRTRRQRLGSAAEDLARIHLTEAGLRCVASNYRCRLGEIDLIMGNDETLVIVEVRYRGTGSRLTARDSVSPAKQRKIMLATEQFLSRHRRFTGLNVRFDVVCIDRAEDGSRRLQWIRDAFRPW